MELSGRLLVALPVITEAPFWRTVVYLLQHGEEGAVGVIINRPTEVHLEAALPGWADRAAAPSVVFEGGPVQPEMAIALGPDGHGVASVDLERDPLLLTDGSVRVYAGYAGWSPGQLEQELTTGSWAVCDAVPGEVFRPDADRLWYEVLARQADPALRNLARLPDDLSVN